MLYAGKTHVAAWQPLICDKRHLPRLLSPKKLVKVQTEIVHCKLAYLSSWATQTTDIWAPEVCVAHLHKAEATVLLPRSTFTSIGCWIKCHGALTNVGKGSEGLVL